MSLEVVFSHLLDFSMYPNIIFKVLELLTTSAVPVFMMMSFYFSYSLFIESDKDSINNRIKKLLIPHIGWSLVYFFIYKLIDLIFHKDLINNVNDLFFQLLLGHSPRLNYAMYFQIILILLTLLYYLLNKTFKDKVHLMLLGLFVICLLLQYSIINYYLFNGLIEEISNPLGRIIETVPYSIIGFMFYKYDVINTLKINVFYYIISILILTIVLFIEYRFINISIEGFGYQGIRLMLISVVVFILFGSVNLNIKNKALFKQLTSFTSGVYYSHLLIGKIIELLFVSIKHSFLECIIVYLLGYLLSFVISKSKNAYIRLLVSN